jgi:CRP-like cAMP-binding protein
MAMSLFGRPSGRHGGYHERLGSLALFRACSEQEVSLIARYAESVRVEAGAVLVREGAKAREFFVVVAGSVVVHRDGAVVDLVGPGDCLGERALLEREPSTSTATALTAVELLAFEARAFNGLLTAVPQFGRNLLGVMARRLREVEGAAATLHSAEAQTA